MLTLRFSAIVVGLAAGVFTAGAYNTLNPPTPSPEPLQSSPAFSPPFQPLRDALKAQSENRKPVLVIISADWCPPCHKMKAELKRLYDRGELEGYNLALVDYDRERTLADSLRDISAGIPQLVRMTHGGAITRQIGYYGPRQLRAFLGIGLAQWRR